MNGNKYISSFLNREKYSDIQKFYERHETIMNNPDVYYEDRFINYVLNTELRDLFNATYIDNETISRNILMFCIFSKNPRITLTRSTRLAVYSAAMFLKASQPRLITKHHRECIENMDNVVKDAFERFRKGLAKPLKKKHECVSNSNLMILLQSLIEISEYDFDTILEEIVEGKFGKSIIQDYAKNAYKRLLNADERFQIAYDTMLVASSKI